MTPTLRIARLAGAVALLLAAAYLFLPTALGGGTTYVTTAGNSMQPRFQTGDLAVLRAADHYAVGDIVAFRSADLNTIVMHRIVARDGHRFITQGDNNSWLDPDEPTAGEMVGKLWFAVPQAGKALRAVQSPWLIGYVAIAALAVLGPTRAPRRRRPARRGAARPRSFRGRRHRTATVPPPAATGSRRGFSTPVRAAARQTVIGAAVAALVAVAGFVALPLLPRASAEAQPVQVTHQGNWTYSGAARTGTTYPTGRIETGDPVYTQLADGITVSFTGAVRGEEVAGVTGALRLDVAVTGGDGWSAALASGRAAVLQDGGATASVDLDLDQAQALLDRHAVEIGAAAAGGTITVTPVVEGSGTVDGSPFALPASEALSFTLDATALRLAGGPEALAASASVDVPLAAATADGSVSVLGTSIPIAPARLLLAAALALALLTLIAAAWVSRGPRGDRTDDFLVRHAARIVPVASFVPTGTVIDVADAESLVRVAERLDTVVLHHAGATSDVFAVQDGDTAFRFVGRRTAVPARSPAPPVATLLGRRFA